MSPQLSVIVPAVNGVPILRECLDALRLNEASGIPLEVLVIERGSDAVRRALADVAPAVTVLSAAADTSIPMMRALGFQHARGDAVAVIEDHVLVPGDWARRMLDALAGGADVVGGSVFNAATTTTVDWAAFFCEYSHLLAPADGRDVTSVTGNNVVYRRALLKRYSALLSEGRWEDHFHQALRRDGVALMCAPEIAVGHKMHYGFMEYLTQRYLYSRSFAGLRATGLTSGGRIVRVAGSLLLPPLLWLRIVTRVLAAQRHRRELARALPLLGLFTCAWAAGEVAGYAAGPGTALTRVR